MVVKPTNHANALIPAILTALPQARAVLMTNPLPSFLAAVIRKGMMGRRWGRLLHLEMQSYAGMELGMDGREQFAMTDLQAAALAWFLAQRWFALQQQRFGERLAVLDGGTLFLKGEVLRPDGSEVAAEEISGPIADGAEMGREIARKILDRTGPDFFRL